MKTVLIVACSKNNVIGKENCIPWYIKEDLQNFKRVTVGNGNNSIVMGRKTFDSIDRKYLKGRINFVLTNEKDKFKKYENIIFTNSIDEVYKEHTKRNLDNLFVIGGNEIYKIFLKENLVEEIYLSDIKITVEGKNLTYFPREYWSKFQITNFEKFSEFDYITYKITKEKSFEYQYLNLVEKILNTDDLCCFGNQMKFDLSKGFPLITTKKMFFKGVVEELLWFLSGQTDAKILKDKGIRIWDKNSSREYLDSVGLVNNNENDLGPIYGHNFRHYGAKYENSKTNYEGKGVDQVGYVINMIRNNPKSRRILINLWNPCQLDEVALPPCHVLYQFKVDEKAKTLSCILYQRSGDVALGIPFNIASASLLTHILAFLTNLKPGILTHFIGDAHIYPEHKEGMIHQLDRYVYPFPILKIFERNQQKPEDFCYEDFELQGYRSNSHLPFQLIV